MPPPVVTQGHVSPGILSLPARARAGTPLAGRCGTVDVLACVMHSGTGMNAIDLLIKQHDELEALIKKVEKASEAKNRAAKNAGFLQIADHLAAHMKIEETQFYPAIIEKQLEDKLLESLEEHLALKRLLADLMELDIDDPRFDAKMSVLKETNEHHTRKEEEKELFPKVKKLLSKDELEKLGNEMLANFNTLMKHDPREEVPAETEQAAPLPAH